MTSTAKKLLDEALSLPEDDRRRLGEALLTDLRADLRRIHQG